MDLNDVRLPPNPQSKANPISKVFFLWLLPFMWTGSKKDLEIEDLYHSLPEDSSEKLGNFVATEWDKEVKSAEKLNKEPSLWPVIRKMIWKQYSLVGIGFTIDELGLRVLQPFILRNFIRTFSESEESYPNLKRDQYLYAGALVLANSVHAVLFQQMITMTIHIGMKVRLGISSLIYRKILRLRKADSEHTNVGRLCNMLSSDVSRFDQGFFLLHFFYISPLQLALYTYLLWIEIGWTCIGGIGCILLFLPFQALVGRFSVYFRTRIAFRTDARGRFLNEIIAGIRLIKMYTWEKPFSAVVSKLRKYEIQYIRKGLYLRGTFVSLQIITKSLIPFCALILFVAVGNVLVADKAFYVISVFGILQTLMLRIPNGASALGEMVASANRIEAFLEADESGSINPANTSRSTGSNGSTNQNEFKTSTVPSINFVNYTASWTEEKVTLKNLQIKLKGDKLVMVVGHVGSGKTSFLHAILSELPIVDDGHCSVEGDISYAPQEPWIFPATLRQNILFGLDVDEEKYWNTIKVCCLEDDLKQFHNGDMTLVGERGVALSGGQKARLSLARCIYQSGDVILLDDPLSAVDTKVSKHLFDNCIKNNLKGKLRILVSHQLQYMPLADYIIVLTRDGGIWFQGTFDEYKKSEVDFSSLINDDLINATDIDELLNKEKSEAKGSSNAKQNASSLSINGNGDLKPLVVTNTSAAAGSRLKDEQKNIGSIGVGAYIKYFKSGGSYFAITVILLTFVGGQVLNNALDYWLGLWTDLATRKSIDENGNSVSTENGSVAVHHNFNLFTFAVANDEDEEFKQNLYAYIYCGLMGAFILVIITRSLLFFNYSMRISTKLHDNMFASLVRAPVKFFDENASGRIMNRFTKDINQIDELLPVAFYDFADIFLNLVGVLTINIAANYFMAVPSVILLIGYWKIRGFYLRSAVNLRRIESILKSPVFTHVALTAQGLSTIRALKAAKRVQIQFEKLQDTHTAAFFMVYSTTRWFAVWLEIMSNAFLAVVSFGFVVIPSSSMGGSVGMAISSILKLSGALQWGIRQSAETENYMTSVERVFEYSNLKPEAPLENANDAQISKSWPNEGRVSFRSVSLSYEEPPASNKVLKDVTFTTEPGEKIGIVGRTGAGKSTLITGLFRLTELCGGVISIDKVEIQNLGLHTLRSKISIIPQDPVLFTGTLRYNLDPFNEFSDDQLWRVLQEVELHREVHYLDYNVADGGSNFSTGQRQLVCLARAILRNNKLIVLDEPTSNVDPATDQMVQQTIRTKFADCTILTIAHRLQSVLDCDRILVLDAGKVVEFDKPEVLAAKPGGIFSAMLKQSNNASSSIQAES